MRQDMSGMPISRTLYRLVELIIVGLLVRSTKYEKPNNPRPLSSRVVANSSRVSWDHSTACKPRTVYEVLRTNSYLLHAKVPSVLRSSPHHTYFVPTSSPRPHPDINAWAHNASAAPCAAHMCLG